VRIRCRPIPGSEAAGRAAFRSADLAALPVLALLRSPPVGRSAAASGHVSEPTHLRWVPGSSDRLLLRTARSKPSALATRLMAHFVRGSNLRMTLPEIRAAALIPTFNNERTLADVVERTLREIPDVLVVDDGSGPETGKVLDRFGARIQRVRHDRNFGKGRALRTGFARLAEAGFTHAIALDSDGQHYPEDLPAFRDAIAREPEAIFVGERDMTGSGAPRKSRFGLWFSNRSLRLLGAARLRDSQCGFRAYPLARVSGLGLRGERYDLELEVLIKAARRGIRILAVPIRVTYSPEGGRTSHFRPVRDFLQIAGRMARILVDRRGR